MHESPRVILLGASNLAMGLPRAVAAARAAAGGPVEVLAAAGHGRSYGHRSRVLVRGLPGIVPCGLWAALEDAGGERPTAALVTDVGNDVAYGVDPAQLANWVETCLDRLLAARARVVLTRLPVPGLRRLGRARFTVLRSLLFPGRSISYETVLGRAAAVDHALEALCRDRPGVDLLDLPVAWYGPDAIHFRAARAAAAWSTMIGRVLGRDLPLRAASAGRPRDRLRLYLTPPERRWIVGRPGGTTQPAVRLPDGSTVGLY